MGFQPFSNVEIDRFASAYPSVPSHLGHQIASHPLLELDALAELARRIRTESIEFNAATDLPLGITNEETPHTGLDVHETIAQIETSGSWVLLKTIDQDPAYAQLMRDVLAELEPVVHPRTGAMMRLEGFVFISSPRAVTPLHFDPEYNILFQARGSKTMTFYDSAESRIISDEFFEQYFAGGPRNLPWQPEWAERSQPIAITPGEAVYVPILNPHSVQVHDEVSISLSLTWRSEWSFHHADACRFNGRLRKLGLNPASPQRYPADNRLKSYSERALARAERMFARN
ncbi:MAG: cupin-like domain-containing protein [Parasphingorhabdus sp.]|uniref:cupin-like domain-containing protein n=1 Tax=Parasphingorhabdus sp. TaxID=2709688 RepID=UPI0032646732